MTMRRWSRRALAAVVLLWLGGAHPARAHDRSVSYSSWEIHGHSAEVTARLAALDLTRYPWAGTAGARFERVLFEMLTAHLQLYAGEKPCAVSEGPRRLAGAEGHVLAEWRLACAEEGALEIRTALFFDVAPSHLHFARVRVDGGAAHERVLSEAQSTWTLAATGKSEEASSLAAYVALGVEHILTGHDHLVFLLALLLVGGTLLEVAKVVTGFTVAHSLTLALAALGYLRPERAAVEALIGLSIALVAIENVWLLDRTKRAIPRVVCTILASLALAARMGWGNVPALVLGGLAVFTFCYFALLDRSSRTGAMRWAVAFLFGLIHGFGFAGVLLEAELPPGRLAAALFGFNAGVEIGQLAAVAAVWPLLRYALGHDGGRLRPRIVELGSAAVLTAGVFWFVRRAFG